VRETFIVLCDAVREKFAIRNSYLSSNLMLGSQRSACNKWQDRQKLKPHAYAAKVAVRSDTDKKGNRWNLVLYLHCIRSVFALYSHCICAVFKVFTLKARSSSVASTESCPRHMTLANGVIRGLHLLEIYLIPDTSK
jgi:hypothetical protein